jgi:hypothetical protein
VSAPVTGRRQLALILHPKRGMAVAIEAKLVELKKRGRFVVPFRVCGAGAAMLGSLGIQLKTNLAVSEGGVSRGSPHDARQIAHETGGAYDRMATLRCSRYP